MSESYGPFKPACVRVSDRRAQQLVKLHYDFERQQWPIEWQLVDCQMEPELVCFTFKDDWAAAEFALRYA